MKYDSDDIKYFDDLPAPIKELLREAPKPFTAKMARQLLDRGYSVKSICEMLRGAFEQEIHDGTMAPMQQFKPITRRKR